MKPFIVNVADLMYRPGARRRERREGEIGDLRVADTSVPPSSAVVVDVLLEWVSDGVLATGTTGAVWQGECRRCLVPVGGEVKVDFRELFEEHPQEGETYLLRHEHIDLEPLAREAVVLDLPPAPLCREDCKGLCATCGADLNEGSCGCATESIDPRWAVLDVLRKEAPPHSE